MSSWARDDPRTHEQVRRDCEDLAREIAHMRGWHIARGGVDVFDLMNDGWPGIANCRGLIDHAVAFRRARRRAIVAVLSHTYLSRDEIEEECAARGLACEYLPHSPYYPGWSLSIILTPSGAS